MHVFLRLDNQSAISFINHKGGTRSSKLFNLVVQIWTWCLERQVTVHAEHIPGLLNVEADLESRRKIESSDWRLDPSIFSQIMIKWGGCRVDLFASRHNCQLPQFFSYHLDPEALAFDAFSQEWTHRSC